MDNLGVADTVFIRHRCHCTTATEEPDECGVIEHAFLVDDEEFPWYISERGPVVTRRADDWYTVEIDILLLDKARNAEGRHEPLDFDYQPRKHVPYIPVIGGVEF